MRTLLTTLFAAFALAAGATAIRPVPAPTYLDGESGVAAATDQQIPSQSGYGFRIDFAGTPSNNVEVAMGKDEDGDGELSPAETKVTSGWDCGGYFIERNEDGQRWHYPVQTRNTNRWVQYASGVRSKKIRTFVVETGSGSLTPDGILQQKTHTLRWRFAANNAPAGVGVEGYLANLRFSEAISPAGDGVFDPVAETLGCPGYSFTSTRQLTPYAGIPKCVYVVCGTNDVVEIETQLISYSGSHRVEFDWCSFREAKTASPAFEFYFDGTKVSSAAVAEVRPDDQTRYPHELKWTWNATRYNTSVMSSLYASIYEMSFSNRETGSGRTGDIAVMLGVPDLTFTYDKAWVTRNPYVDTPAFASDETRMSHWLSTTAKFNGTVTFKWNNWMGSSDGYGALAFYIDGVQKYNYDYWAHRYDHPSPVTFTVPAGQMLGVSYTFTGSGTPTGKEWVGTDADGFQTHALRWVYSKDGSVDRGQDRGAIRNLRFTNRRPGSQNYGGISAALGVPDIPFGGTWLPDGTTARSKPIYANQSSEMTANVSFGGAVMFDWTVSSEGNYDKLAFYLDGAKMGEISGDVGWTGKSFVPGQTGEGPNWVWDRSWDTMKVTTRGVGATNESTTYHIDQTGGLLMLR